MIFLEQLTKKILMNNIEVRILPIVEYFQATNITFLYDKKVTLT